MAGSLTRQFGQMGWPCPSRVAGSRRAFQREHCSIPLLAMLLRQTHWPFKGLAMRTARRQRGQTGRTPPSRSRSISRRTAGAGARLSSNAQANRRWCVDRTATERTAAATACGSTVGSSAVTWSVIDAIGSRHGVRQTAEDPPAEGPGLVPGLGAPADGTRHDRPDTPRLQPVLDHGDQRRDSADRVRHRVLRPRRHGVTPRACNMTLESVTREYSRVSTQYQTTATNG